MTVLLALKQNCDQMAHAGHLLHCQQAGVTAEAAEAAALRSAVQGQAPGGPHIWQVAGECGCSLQLKQNLCPQPHSTCTGRSSTATHQQLAHGARRSRGGQPGATGPAVSPIPEASPESTIRAASQQATNTDSAHGLAPKKQKTTPKQRITGRDPALHPPRRRAPCWCAPRGRSAAHWGTT